MKAISFIVTILINLVYLSLFTLGLSPAYAQSPTPQPITDDQVNAIAKQMYCPVCENVPLDVCPTQACAEWRDLIRDKLTMGWNDDQIKNYFVDQYGDRVLATPPSRGLNWLIYIIPPLAFLAGIFILFRAFQAWRNPVSQAAAPPAQKTPDDDYAQRLEEELKKL